MYKEETKLPVIPTIDILLYFFLILLLYIFYIILSNSFYHKFFLIYFKILFYWMNISQFIQFISLRWFLIFLLKVMTVFVYELHFFVFWV